MTTLSESAPSPPTPRAPSRELLLHMLYEAAELEHNLMCTYLYAAFSLRTGESDLSADEAEAVERWRRCIMRVAVDEMGHLTAVWNITAALGGAPRFGRGNFPLDPGMLPAGVVVKLAPFSEQVLQHFIYLERPANSSEPEGDGFASLLHYQRGDPRPRLTPMAVDYDTVGVFYHCLGDRLRDFVAHVGESAAFCGDPALQLSPQELQLAGAQPVRCLKTALAAFDSIVLQGEGASADELDSHYQKFTRMRHELHALLEKNPGFRPAVPAAVNPVLRRPLRPEGRVWIEDELAAATVDAANVGYALQLRLLAHAYTLRSPSPEKALTVDLALGLMRAMTHLAERAARLPAGPSYPDCNAGMSFTALRDASALPPGAGAWRFFLERLDELSAAVDGLVASSAHDARLQAASRQLSGLRKRAAQGLSLATTTPTPAAPVHGVVPVALPPASADAPLVRDGVEHVEGAKMTLLYEGKKCIHARFCVTGAPRVFLANVVGPWIHPDAMDVDALVEIAHACPSGAIRYRRKDGRPDEAAPPVNLIAIREAGPYAVRGELLLDGVSIHQRATLCRCGASQNKPYCDGSHHQVSFQASGEPPTGQADMLPVRDGALAIEPQMDGPLQLRGNLEITSGTGRVVARVTSARLCRCGASGTKPFCDNSHARVGFRSD